MFPALQDRSAVASWKTELKAPLEGLGAHLRPVRRLRSRVFSRCTCALRHATAGRAATQCIRTCPSTPTTTRCCRRRTPPSRGSWRSRGSLGGVISGEHGIGITKLEYLTADELAVRRLQGEVDPQGRFNARKLLPGADLAAAYTPSFSLIGHESLILEASRIGEVADSIKDCLRCGKCKPVCATHVPRANLLYEEQTRRGVSLRTRRSLGRRRPLHRLPQVRTRARSTSTSATCRSRCATSCATRAGAPFHPARRRRCSSSTRPTRRRSSSRSAR